MMRTLLELRARVGRPGVLLRLGDSGGRLLYAELRTGPEFVAVALDESDVGQVHAALGRWLAERQVSPPPPRRPAPLVAGRIARGLHDAATVQSRTVHSADQRV